MQSRRTLICAAMPFGYGPAAKLLALAPHIKEDWRLIFIGRGTAAELVDRHRDRFDSIVDSTSPTADIVSLVGGADAVLSIMDREIAAWSHRLRKPLYAVDSLLWMRREIPPELRHATIYWAQRFGNDNPPPDSPTLEMVGPVLATEGPTHRRRGLVINLGGCGMPDGPSPILEQYFDFITEGLAASGLCERYADSILLVGQAHVTNLQRRLTAIGCSIQVRSMSHDEALSCLREATVVLTAPGLTATLESFRNGRPTFFLPPQNYSQWCILHRLRRMMLAPLAFHWQDLRFQPDLVERVEEAQRAPLVQQAICEVANDPLARDVFRAYLASIATETWDSLGARQANFLDSLGDCGTTRIATRLSEVARGATIPAPIRPTTAEHPTIA